MTELLYNLKGKTVWVAGHNGMVGRSVCKRLKDEPVADIITSSRAEVDLRDQRSVVAWMEKQRPDVVIIAAAKVGGIYANDIYPAEFIYENLMIASNIIHTAHVVDTEKLLFLGSSCIYPKFAAQPMIEDCLLTGALEPTNEWYAVAKIAGIKLCEAYRKQYGKDFISAMPTNLYGPHDNYHPENSHVIPALLRKAHEAKVNDKPGMSIWGSGTPKREFLYAEDCADAIIHILKYYSEDEHINVGSGTDIAIGQLAKKIMNVVGFKGDLITDSSKPDGTPRKLMSGSKLKDIGWAPKVGLDRGLELTYKWFLEHEENLRQV